jgi:hypothetical protein
MITFKHSAVGFGTLETPTPDKRRSRGPISLHNAIEGNESKVEITRIG